MRESITRLFGGEKEKSNNPEEIKQISVQHIVASPYQPRALFDEDKIDELCQTIKTHGFIQPIVVRQTLSGYELIAGERRLRAARKLGMETIPSIIKEFNDAQAASIALIENLQREGLTAIEEAVAYQQLIELHGLTQESLAQRLGKGQSTIANKLRLLNLPDVIQQSLMKREITERHARALLVLPDKESQLRVLNEILDKEWNVKQTETRIKILLESKMAQTKKPKRFSFSKDMRLAVNTIRQSVDMVMKSGLSLHTDEKDHEDYYEFIIKIPKNKN